MVQYKYRSMSKFIKVSLLFLLGTALLVVMFSSSKFFSKEPSETVTVEIGTVLQSSKISGFIEARQTAKLGFPTVGTVREVFKLEGDTVSTGEIVASLTQSSIVAQYSSAQHELAYYLAQKEELLAGQRTEARQVTDATVQVALNTLEKTKSEHAQITQNAYRKLLSADLEAVPADEVNDDTPPRISGNYLCDKPGTYTLNIYSSKAVTGYSYILSGLEEGTFPAWTDTPVPIGTCGLFIQFSDAEQYQKREWSITIPNDRGSSYITNYNAYQLSLQQQQDAITAATLALELAEKQADYTNADPTQEAIAQIDAKIRAAQSLLEMYEAKIADYVITAPFDGIITDVDLKVGEVSDITKTVTLIRNGSYLLKARIPEVDIRMVSLGMPAEVTFDAAAKEIINTTVSYISPLSINLDGVSYYEAHLTFVDEPDWLREGLNADITLIVNKKSDVLVVPKQYTEQAGADYFVYTLQGNDVVTSKIETGLIGDNGYIEVLNLPAKTKLILP
jgi:multidrug efflux pump subunit AcrA (membrane-fusion protein)